MNFHITIIIIVYSGSTFHPEHSPLSMMYSFAFMLDIDVCLLTLELLKFVICICDDTFYLYFVRLRFVNLFYH